MTIAEGQTYVQDIYQHLYGNKSDNVNDNTY
jgi:hypothetical protein